MGEITVAVASFENNLKSLGHTDSNFIFFPYLSAELFPCVLLSCFPPPYVEQKKNTQYYLGGSCGEPFAFTRLRIILH